MIVWERNQNPCRLGWKQRDRFAESNLTCNAGMRPGDIREHYQFDETGNSLIRTAMNQKQLSARAYHRVIKLALTIADLVGEENSGPSHLA